MPTHPTRNSQDDPQFEKIWDAAASYKYALESSNDAAWKKFETAVSDSLKTKKNPIPTVRRTRWPLIRIAAAAVVLLVGILSYWTVQQDTSIPVLAEGTIQTNQAEVKQIVLPDNSILTLNANSSVSYTIRKTERLIQLKGMAHFEVAKNPHAPFTIVAGSNRVTVLGTGFDVRSYTNKPLQITVNHGRVRVEKTVTTKEKNTRIQAILTNGMRLTQIVDEKNNTIGLNEDAIQTSINALNPYLIESNINLDAVQWQTGDLVFNHAILSELMTAIESRYGVVLRILGNENPSSRLNSKLHFTGKFRNTDKVETVCKTVGAALNIVLVVKH
ncbi:MAG: DUF4974 domain-containing protein [Flavobacteriaceae bacterium]|nr:DUF4974 domain-containing protein [Flavobacteriaceae bacterium]